MKNKILIILFSIGSFLFAESGLELGIFVPIGIGVGIHYYDDPPSSLSGNQGQLNAYKNYISNNTVRSQAGLDAGLIFQAGYRLELNKNMSISFMGEFGYSRDSFRYRLKDSGITNISSLTSQSYISYNFDSVLIGVLPKFNFNQFSVGIGAGVKIIAGGNIAKSDYNKFLEIDEQRIKIINDDIRKKYLYSSVIPYLKLTFDYSLYSSKKFDLVLGAYIGYDFAVKHRNGIEKDNKEKNAVPVENISSVDIGIQIGTKIRPMS